MNFSEIVQGYITAALWADCMPLPVDPTDAEVWEYIGATTLPANSAKTFQGWRAELIESLEGETGGLERLDPDVALTEYAKDHCAEFLLDANFGDVTEYLNHVGHHNEYSAYEKLGHDIWLTSHGHGAGFRDRMPYVTTIKRLEVAAGNRVGGPVPYQVDEDNATIDAHLHRFTKGYKG